MSYSRVKPTPPKICCAVAVTSRKVLHAKNFAIGASRSIGLPVGARPRRLVHERLRAVDRGRGVGEVMRDRLERAERLVELLAVLRVLHGDVERVLRAADCLRGEQDDAVEHRVVPRRPARARGADASRAGTRTPDVTAYCVSEAIVSCCVDA